MTGGGDPFYLKL